MWCRQISTWNYRHLPWAVERSRSVFVALDAHGARCIRIAVAPLSGRSTQTRSSVTFLLFFLLPLSFFSFSFLCLHHFFLTVCNFHLNCSCETIFSLCWSYASLPGFCSWHGQTCLHSSPHSDRRWVSPSPYRMDTGKSIWINTTSPCYCHHCEKHKLRTQIKLSIKR